MNDTVLILENFISDDEHQNLKSWIAKEFNDGIMPLLPSANKCYPKCHCIQNRQDGIKEFYDVLDRIIAKFGDFPVAKPLGHFTLVMPDGAKLGKHVDTGKKHFRCNLLIQKPESGSIYIGKKSYSLNEKAMCCFFPSEMLHWSDEIKGIRSTCSYGFIVPENWSLK